MRTTLRCKLAEASLRGEGWGEGVRRPFVKPTAKLTPMRLPGVDALESPVAAYGFTRLGERLTAK
jgi:hypothetical protein